MLVISLNKFLKISLSTFFLLIFTISLQAASDSDKYFYAKKNYVTAVLSSNTKKEIKYLKVLIILGSKLNKDVKKYKEELYKLDKSVYYIESKKIKITKKKVKDNKKYNISNVKVDDNMIIIDFTHNISKKHITFKEHKKSSYYYDVFDLKGNFKDASPTKLKINGINKIRISQYRYKTLRISIRNKYNTKSIYIINKKRLIIKVFPKKYTKKVIKKHNVKLIPAYKNELIRNKTIVIDPGHGGKDSGAVGSSKKYEKIAVLKISKYLRAELKSRGYKVYLTRTNDKYIKLTKRTKYANKKNADMFISIHANSVPKSKARKTKGIETYFLSPARSARSKRVAAKENKGDIKSLGYSSKNIVLNLLNRSKITSSQKMAIDIQGHMLHNLKKYYGNKIVDKGVREGPFWVLVGAQMPSVLIEVGYISHPTESKRIYSTNYQKRIAKGIANGIDSYFSKN